MTKNEIKPIEGTPVANLSNAVATIVCAYVANNSVPPTGLPSLIALVHSALASLHSGAGPAVVQEAARAPAVPIKKSVTNEYVICLEDGKKFKSLKRHLGAAFNMTPEQYRAKWGLPRDYPMVAPGYAAVRSQLAKDIGLGSRSNPSDGRPLSEGMKAA